MKNYLDHSSKVMYMDGLLECAQDWQWFIDLIQGTFEIEEINTWDEYMQYSNYSREIFMYFVNILNVSSKTCVFKNENIEEIWEIARYFTDAQTVDDCRRKMKSNHGRTLLFCIWITKLGLVGSDTQYLYDIRILINRNYYQLVNIDSYMPYIDELLKYACELNITGIEKPIKCLTDNLSKVLQPFNENFFDEYGGMMLRYDAFSYQSISIEEYATWQEKFLIDMLKVEIKDRHIQPMMVLSNGTVPDIVSWTEEVVHMMKNFFNNEHAEFILDTILYIKDGIAPPEKCRVMHARLLAEAFRSEEQLYKVFGSSSYEVISSLFEDKLFEDCKDNEDYCALLQSIQNIENTKYLIQMKNDKYPLSSQQKTLLKEFYQSKYKSIENVDNLVELMRYLSDSDNSKQITLTALKKVSDKFSEYVSSEVSVVVSSAFYKYMVFLIWVNEKNQVVDKRWVHAEMIRIQKLWQNEYYEMQIENMTEFSYEQEIASNDIDLFNRMVIANPIIFAKKIMPCSNEAIVSVMGNASEFPMTHLVGHIALNPIFPDGSEQVEFNRHDIDKLWTKQIEEVFQKFRYRLLNVFKPEEYLVDIHKRCKEYTQFYTFMFRSEECIYKIIQDKTEIPLMQYSNPITLGMLTQLFPILEIMVRKLAMLFNIFPFKKRLNEFMQYNDPSTLLREVLDVIYNEHGSFENVADILFVYNAMYNSNSYNVRNECIHGRDYLRGTGLIFAFKITVLSIYMIIFRIETIEANVSDILVLDI